MAADDHRPSDLYERDFYLWTQAQAEALRAEGGRQTAGSNVIDWEHVAEEIEDMGKSDLRECCSRVETIIEHLYKLSWSRHIDPVAGWRATISRERLALEAVMTASLRAKVEASMDQRHARGMKLANIAFSVEEPDAPRNETLTWTLAQILGEKNDPLG